MALTDVQSTPQTHASQVVIECARTPDIPALVKLHAEAFPRGWSPAEMAALLAARGACTFIARIADVPVGFVISRAPANEAEIISIAIGYAFRRRGIATALMQTLHGSLEARACEAVFLEVEARNSGALAVYNQQGYRRVGVRKDYYKGSDGRRTDALVLKKSLAPER